MMNWGYGDSGWMMVVALVVVLLLIALTVALGFTLYGGSAARDGSPDTAGRSSAAERVLEMRFARGEIDADELEQAKQALRH
jgi:uncharacterized membrane protein